MLSRTSRYGIRALLYLAANTRDECLIGVRDLAQKTEISEQMLSKVLQSLTRRGIIKSKKGRKGGFYMTQAQKNMKLIQVLHELEQTEHLISVCLLGQKHCNTLVKCPYHDRVSGIRSELLAIYTTDTIEQTAQKLMQSSITQKH